MMNTVTADSANKGPCATIKQMHFRKEAKKLVNIVCCSKSLKMSNSKENLVSYFMSVCVYTCANYYV